MTFGCDDVTAKAEYKTCILLVAFFFHTHIGRWIDIYVALLFIIYFFPLQQFKKVYKNIEERYVYFIIRIIKWAR